MRFSRDKPCREPGLLLRDTAPELSFSVVPWWWLPYYARQRRKYRKENVD